MTGWERRRARAWFCRAPAVPEAGKILVGTAGWSYPDWKGVLYPPRPPRGFDPLVYLARYLDLVEINSTFYRPPTPRSSESWAKKISPFPKFRFTLKLYRGFTHDLKLSGTLETDAWDEGIAPLEAGGRVGAILAQFPYSFHRTAGSCSFLAALRDRFPDSPLVAEFRHGSWDSPETAELLAALGIGFCNIDQPRVSFSLGPSALATSPVGYVRLHGRNVREWFRPGAGRDRRYDYLYRGAELEEWEDRIRSLAGRTPEVYVVANNHFRAQAVCNALQIRSALDERRLKIPPLLLEAYPDLDTIAARP
ncbi:MAG TPA: DUF72 domain-containing protein [bacterium]|nr:DUF72 domain-containing protein [bacterium]